MFETVFEGASEPLLRIIRGGLDECARLQNGWLCTEHLFLALLHESDSIGGQALASLKIDVQAARKEVTGALRDKDGSEPRYSQFGEPAENVTQKTKLRSYSSESEVISAMSETVIDALKRAIDYSLFFGEVETQPEHLLLAILDIHDSGVHRVLEELAANVPFLRRMIMALSARSAYCRDKSPGLRNTLIDGFNILVTRYQSHVNALTKLSARAGGISIGTPGRGKIVHMVCMAYLGDFLNIQIAYQRYLLEENIRGLGQRIGTVDKELTASIVSGGAQNLRAEVRSTIEHIWCNQYRLLTRFLDEAEHDLIGSVIEDLWWAHSEEIALENLFAEALDDHRRKQVFSLQKRRMEIGQRLEKLRIRLEDTVRQCFANHSISA